MVLLSGTVVLPRASVELGKVTAILIVSVKLDLSAEQITAKASILWQVVLLTAA